MIITRATRLIDVTVGDLLDYMKSEQPAAHTENYAKQETAYVYGLSGIAKLFGCSTRSAQVLKSSGKIDKAITQDGRKIVVDANLALELVKKAKR